MPKQVPVVEQAVAVNKSQTAANYSSEETKKLDQLAGMYVNVCILLSMFVYNVVIAPDFFNEEDVWGSFTRMEIAFINSLSQHSIDFTTLGADIKSYCENRFAICEPSFVVSSAKELFACVKRLPYHNIFNVDVLIYLACCSGIGYLEQLVKQYRNIFFSKTIRKLLSIANTAQVQIITADRSFTIRSFTSCTKLKEDITLIELNGFTIEYAKAILHLKSGVIQPTCFQEGCICIEWIIPAQLAHYAFHSACLNIKNFEKLNLKYVSVGRYKAELVEGSLESM